MLKKRIFISIMAFCLVACVSPSSSNPQNNPNLANMENQGQTKTATFGAGCFWCVEVCFQQIEGVKMVVSGYSGGKTDKPTYKDICTGLTGHAEVCQVTFDPKVISFEEILEVFWTAHDPTTLNRQGNDAGTQYRSVVFYHDESQKAAAEKMKQALNDANAFGKPVVTEISPLTNFFKAENYHQNYYNENSEQPYCVYVAKPKLDKVRKVFKDKLKKN